MRKFSILFLCISLTLALTACKETPAASGTTEASEPVTSTAAETEADTPESTAATSPETTDGTQQTSAADAFTGIDVELTTGTLTIRFGSAFSLTYEDGRAAAYSVTDGTLYIADPAAGELVLTLPEGACYDAAAFRIGQGHLYVEGSLQTSRLTLELGQGEAKLEAVSVLEGCEINVTRGSAYLSGTLGGEVDAQCTEGHLQLQVSGQQTDYNYALEVSSGNIAIGSSNYSGLVSKSVDSGAGSTMRLSCQYGDIAVQFRN